MLTENLEERLKCHIQFSKKVFEIKKSVGGTYILDINRKEQMRVGAIIVATPATEYRHLFKNTELTEFFNEIVTASIGFILLSFPKGAIKNQPSGFGFVTPRRDASHITSAVLLDKKWPVLNTTEETLVGVNFGRRGED